MDSPKHLKTEEVKSQIKKLIKQTLGEALEAELEEFLGYPKHKRTSSDNSRNGYSQKEVKTESGEVEIRPFA